MNRIFVPAALVFAGVFALLLSAPGAANAGGCGFRSSYYYPYRSSYYYPRATVVKEVVKEVPVAYPVPFTVAVPVVSYLYNGGGYKYAPVYQAQPTAPAGKVHSQPQATYNQPHYPRQAQQSRAAPADPFASLTDKHIDYLIDRIEARLAARNQQPQQPPATAPPPTAPPPKEAPPQATAPDPAQILMMKRGSKQKSCMDCHTGSSAKGNFQIFLQPNVLNPDVDWFAIWDRTDAGTMPPEAKTNYKAALSDMEVAVFRELARGQNGKK